ncbi:tail protein X [Sphingomonas hylomeconis]|uniref:Tail protein X n=1 Tax=Sphingomonas hylomeconis TaxID=1395958 RepID=A0ABV7SRW7_9SPHN|nr:tail protein X [Sphingomonas hylomeconis]
MADAVAARQDETLDALIWRTRGLGPSDLGPVLEANPGLAELGTILPAGKRVVLPETPPAPVVRDIIQLWD